MLIKITLTLLVISIALYIITRVYKTGEKILFMITGFTYMITFVIAVIAVISLILKYL